MDDSLRQRLRSLAERDVRETVATTHLARMATVRPRRALTSALAVAVTVVGSAAVVGAALAAQSPGAVSTRPSPDAVAAPPFEVPRRETVTANPQPTGDEAPPASTDPCVGPPPFAGVKPTDGPTRAAEAIEFAQVRAACHATTTTTSTTSTTMSPLATPERVPAGPPSSVPVGPPPDRPVGPPADRPVGPPPDRPVGPPADRPVGPPPDVPAGPPDSVPVGPPPDVPSGPPDDVPVGPPDDVPPGPPADRPGRNDGGG
jgi:hypothetical protein